MNKLYYLLLALLSIFPLSASAVDQNWYFPIQGFETRQQYKTFDQHWDKNAYKGKEALFPTQFTGYHVADDLEINKGEENQNVPVYAVSDGKITFAGPVGGYGGSILLSIANDSHTALYGHIKLSSLKVKAGDSVKAGQELAYLGNAFSSETGGERKHLHFGIYNGKGIYYRGYESSEATVRNKWVDPMAYLKQKGAVDVSQPASVSSVKRENSNQSSSDLNVDPNNTIPSASDQPANQDLSDRTQNKNFTESILQYLKNIFSKARSIL